MNAVDPTERRTAVFINCPFSSDYATYLDAIVFTVLYFGFQPRSALESGSTSIPRMERIHCALRDSQYSVHDLSRIHGEPETGIARMNMPFELGMAVGIHYLEKARGVSDFHDWTAHVPPGREHEAAVSDLKGFDPPGYESRRELVVDLSNWLRHLPYCPRPNAHPGKIWGLLARFDKDLVRRRKEAYNRLAWEDMIALGRRIIEGSMKGHASN